MIDLVSIFLSRFSYVAHLWLWRIYGPVVLTLQSCLGTVDSRSFIILEHASQWDGHRLWDPGGLDVAMCGAHFIVLPANYSEVQRSNGMKQHWWLIDSGAGKTMSFSKEDFIYIVPWTGGTVQVGNGTVLNVTHRGIVQLYARGPDGSTVALPELKDAWYIPSLAFKIVSVSDLSSSGIASRFGETGKCRDYLHVHHTQQKLKLKAFHGIYVLPTVAESQVAASVKVDKKRLIDPKLHIVTDLWFYFGRQSPSGENIFIREEGDISQYCGRAPMPAITALDALDIDFGNDFSDVNANSPEDADFKLASRRLSAMVSYHRTVPETIYRSPSVTADVIFDELSRVDDTADVTICGICPAIGEADTGNGVRFPNNKDCWSWCGSRDCENQLCSFALVNRTGLHSKNKSNGMLQHYRSGCTSYDTLCKGCQNGYIAGMEVKTGSFTCQNCLQCKAKRASFTSKQKVPKSEEQISFEKSQNPIVFDYCGPVPTKSKGGANGFFGATTKIQKYCQVFPVKSKGAAWECIEAAILHLRSKFQTHCFHVHTDNAMEHKSSSWKQLEREMGFHTTYSPDYTPQKNSLAEFMNYVLCTKALCMMTLGSAPAWSWAVALAYACVVWNSTPPADGKSPSPLQMLTGFPPDHSMFRVFWCKCYPLFFKEQGRKKFEIKTRGTPELPCRFAGLGPTQPDSWLIYDPVRDQFFESAHCSFDESDFDGSKMLDGMELEDREWSVMMEKLASEVGLWIEDADPNWRNYVDPASGGVSDIPTSKPTWQGKVEQNQNLKSEMPNQISDIHQGENYDYDYPPLDPAVKQEHPPHFKQERYEGEWTEQQAGQNIKSDVFGSSPPKVRSPVTTRSRTADMREMIFEPEPKREAHIAQDVDSGTYTYAGETQSGIKFEVEGITELEAARVTSPDRAARIMLEGPSVSTSEEPAALNPEALATMIADVKKIQDQRATEGSTVFVEQLIVMAAAARINEQNASQFPDMTDPLSFKEAMARPDADLWEKAIQAEMRGMDDLDVWEVIYDESTVPKGTNITRSKGIYKIKRLANGDIDKHKFRLVACGYSQIYGVDYTETYSGVVDNVVIRIFFAICAELGLFTKMVDVSQAFLYGELDPSEIIFMRLPKELGSLLVRLKKALYGLKQAGRVFNRSMAKFLKSIGYKQSIIEPCLFYIFTKEINDVNDPKWNGLGISYIISHVDDMPIASNSEELISWTTEQIKTKFKITISDLDFFISLSINVDRKHLRVSFHQEHFVIQLIKEFNSELMEYCSNKNGDIITKDLPMKPGLVLSKVDCPQSDAELAEVRGLRYPQLVGALLYLVNSSRHDLLVAVGNCAKFMSNFGMVHWLACLQILQYLVKYPKIKIVFEGSGNGDGLVVYYEVDASYADCPDTRRSRWGCLGFLVLGVIDAKSGILKSAMPSTGAAEQSALAKCVLRVLATRNYLEDFGFPQWDPTPIGEDNTAALLNSRNPVKSKSQKHLDVYHHITRENQMEFKTINVYRLGTESMRADLLTKNLPHATFWKHVNASYMHEPKKYEYNGVSFAAC